MKTTRFSRFTALPVPLWALVAASPVYPLGRTLFYMQGEGVAEHWQYLTYTISEGWPFLLAYLLAALCLALLSRLSPAAPSDVLDK